MSHTDDHPWTRFGGTVTIVMTLVGWSSVPLFLKHFSHLIDPWTSNGWRYGFSALLWLPVLVAGLAQGTLPPRLWRAALVPSLFNTASQTVFCWAHYKIDPGLLTFGLRSNIVFATLGAALLFAAERRIIRTPAFLAGLVMVGGGTAATVLMGRDVFGGATLGGFALAVASGAGFAAYSLSVRRAMHDIGALQSFAAISLYSALPMISLMIVLGESRGATAWGLLERTASLGPVILPGGQFTVLLLSALIGIALGHVFYYYSIRTLGVTVSAGVVQLQPFLVSVASLWLFGETLTAGQWAAGGVAVLGAVVVLAVQHREAARRRRAARGEYADLPPDHVVAAAEVSPRR